MNVKVTNLQSQPISLSNGVQLAAAGTKGSTLEVAPSERIRKLAAKELIFIHPEPAAATPPAVSASGTAAADKVPAGAASAAEKRSKV